MSKRSEGRSTFDRVPINLSPRELREWYRTHKDWLLYLEDEMTAGQLRGLYERHINSPYCDWGIIGNIAEHQNTPVDILVALGKRRRWGVLLSLATNPNLPVVVIERLSRHRNTSVVEHLIYNPSTPIYVLERLAGKGSDEFIRDLAKQVLKKRKRQGDQNKQAEEDRMA